MQTSGFTGRLARSTARHPWWTIAVWVVVLAGSFLLAGGLGDVLVDGGELSVETESEQAESLLAQHFEPSGPPTEYVLVEAEGLTTEDPAFASAVADLAERLRFAGTVGSVVSYVDGAPGMVSEDGTVALMAVALAGDGDPSSLAAPVVDAVDATVLPDGMRATTIGSGSVNNEFNQLAEETLQRGELLGIPTALVILVVVFGAAVAAGIPLILAIVSIIVAVGLTVIVGQAMDLSTFVMNMITMIGLAVGIDYSLFIVQRFREERAAGASVIDSVEIAGDSAIRAVFFSGMTVVIALLGLLYMPDTVMRSLGIGAIVVVLAALAAALTLLPAVLGLLGDRVNKGRLPFISGARHRPDGKTFWHRITNTITARPVVSIVLAGGLLIAAAAPYLGLNTGQNFIESLPEESNSRHAWTLLNEHFDSGSFYTTVVVDGSIDDPSVAAAVAGLTASLEADAAYGDVSVAPSPDGHIVAVNAVTKLDPSTLEARDAVESLREELIPAAFGGVDARAFVTGGAAGTVDYVEVINSRTPAIFGFVLGLSFVLLMLVFRSIVVPLKAIAMNLLSVGAAYGLLVLVFQHGVGADLFGFQQTDIIEAWIPLFLFAVLFGLSMDYHIFLLSRIKEHYDLTGDNTGSVAFGLSSTGAIITGAALIMVAVFGGFAAGDLVMFQQMGFGLAAAVVMDATIVRSILVPATMKLLGDRNWYFPRWLDWLPEIHIEGKALPAYVPEQTLEAA